METTNLLHSRKLHVVWLMLGLAVGLSPAVGQELPLFGPAAVVNVGADLDSGDDTALRVAGDGAGTVVAVWVTNEQAAGVADLGPDLDLAVAVSSDGGATWSAPQPLNSDAATDATDDISPAIATDANGNWVVVWQAVGTGSTTSTEIRYASSSDNGATWSDVAPFTHAVEDVNPAGADLQPAVASGGDGRWLAVWTSSRDIDGNLEPFEPEDEDDVDPEIPIVTTDQDIFVAVSDDDGQSWGFAAPLNLNHLDDAADDAEPTIATDGAGNWMVVWTSGGELVFARSIDNGNTFLLTGTLPDATGTNPQLVNDGAREVTETTSWFAIWEGAGVFVSRYLESDLEEEIELPDDEVYDEWLEPIQITPSGSNAGVANGGGRWIVAWEDGDILASLSVDVGRNWTAPAAVDEDGDAEGASPQPAPVAEDDWVMLWSSPKERDGTGADADLFVSAFTFGVFADCNGNGINDADDIANETSQDCNGNNIPDECRELEVDSDGDGIIDACDETPFGDGDGGANGDGDGDGEGDANAGADGDGGGGGGGGGGGFCALGIMSGLPGILLGMLCLKLGIGRQRRR